MSLEAVNLVFPVQSGSIVGLSSAVARYILFSLLINLVVALTDLEWKSVKQLEITMKVNIWI